MSLLTGKSLGLAVCPRCRQTARLPEPAARAGCPRCGGDLATRIPHSRSTSLAFLIAAALLYLPANLLPIMDYSTAFGTERDTIMSGIVVLLGMGSWPLAGLVFFASILVPLAKLLALSLLLWSVRPRGSGPGGASAPLRSPMQATRLFRLLEFIGRWSMLDIYVLTLLAGLVQIESLATVQPGAGALAFGAVVVCTMLSAQSFDPRLIWDAAATPDADHARAAVTAKDRDADVPS